MKKKNYIILIFACLLSSKVFSQSFQLLVSPKPSPYFSDWSNRTETARIIVNNTSGASFDCKIKTQLFNSSGNVVGETNFSKMPIITIAPGISQFNAEDIYPVSALIYNGGSQNSIAQTGRIPDDNYRLCSNLMDPVTGIALNGLQPQCAVFTIAAYQAPVLIAPREEEIIPLNNIRGMIFRWSPVTPTPNYIATYKLQVWEVLEGQDNVTAIRTNQPIVDKDYKGLTQTQWPVDFTLPEEGKKYVWTITAIDDQDRKMVDGIGIAEPKGFSVKNGLPKSTPPFPKSMPPPPTPNNGNSNQIIAAANIDTIKAGSNGEFTIIVTNSTKNNTTNEINGKGYVYINWLMATIAVEFEKIKIDSTKKLIKGGIIAKKNPNASSAFSTFPKAWAQSYISTAAWAANMTDGLTNFTNNSVNGVVDWVNNNNGNLPNINYQSNIPTPQIPANYLTMPFGIQFAQGAHKLVLTEMIFKPNESKLNFLVQTEYNGDGTTHKLGFAGKSFLFKPNQILFNNGRIELAEDLTLPNINNKIEFTLKKGTTTSGCYIQWADTGVNNFSFEIVTKFTREWLIPIPSTNATSKVAVTFKGNGTSINDLLMSGIIPTCEIVDAGGLKITQADTLKFDMSDIRNIGNITFPTNYPLAPVGPDWRGFYLRNLNIQLPEAWKTQNTNPNINVNVTNLIIDNLGITVKVNSVNIYAYPNASVADMKASVDTVEIAISNSSLQYGKAVGKLVLPISDNTISSNKLKYTATFSLANNTNSLQFVMVPLNDISADILKATITVKPTSNFTAAITGGNYSVSLQLDGVFKWNNPNLQSSINNTINSLPGYVRQAGIKNVKLECEFENLKLDYSYINNTNNHTATFNAGNWSFASPQKLIANFPVSIENVKYKSLTTEATGNTNIKELIRGAIQFDIIANLNEDIGGSTSISAIFYLRLNKSQKSFDPKYVGLKIDSIEIHADLAAVKINGCLALFDNNPTYGDGFSASIEVFFSKISSKVAASVMFGNTVYGNNNVYYRYWKAEANVILPPGAGIPFLPGIAFYGFGGGAYNNMKATENIQQKRFDFTPKKSSIGFILMATVGTYPKFETFNMDAKLIGQFSNTGGMTMIAFDGDFWVGASLNTRTSAKTKGILTIDYDFIEKEFDLIAEVNINHAPAIQTTEAIDLKLKINGKTNLWYFTLGTFANPNDLQILGVNVYEYLMFGNSLPSVPAGFTQKYITKHTAAMGWPPPFNSDIGGNNTNSQTGKGFALGVGLNIYQPYSKEFFTGVCRKWSAEFIIDAGSELNLSFMQYNGCQGINGYRAKGSIGAYANINSSLKATNYQWPNTTGCGTQSYISTEIKLSAGLYAQFPRTNYAVGYIKGNLTVGDLINKPFDEYFIWGNVCDGTATVSETVVAQQDKAADFKNNMIQYIEPTATTNFPINAPIRVKYALTPDEVFDIAETQGDGSVKNRTFRMKITRTLEIKSTTANTYSIITCNTKKMNNGEYFYWHTKPFTFNSNTTSTATLGSTQNIGTIANNSTLFIPGNSSNLGLFYIQNPIPPPAPPNYPNPVPSPQNQLDNQRKYKFKVIATLEELNTDNVWVTAKTKTNQLVVETKTFIFNTPNLTSNYSQGQ